MNSCLMILDTIDYDDFFDVGSVSELTSFWDYFENLVVNHYYGRVFKKNVGGFKNG